MFKFNDVQLMSKLFYTSSKKILKPLKTLAEFLQGYSSEREPQLLGLQCRFTQVSGSAGFGHDALGSFRCSFVYSPQVEAMHPPPQLTSAIQLKALLWFWEPPPTC